MRGAFDILGSADIRKGEFFNRYQRNDAPDEQKVSTTDSNEQESINHKADSYY